MSIDVKKIARMVGKGGITLYAVLYLGVSAHVGYDYLRHNRQRIEQGQTVQQLEVRRYHITIDDREKELTLVGEDHYYTKKEHTIAQNLVDEHEHFAEESGTGHLLNMPLRNVMYAYACLKPLEITLFYQHLGNGRWYDSVREIAEERGYVVHPLENADDPFTNMSPREKVSFLAESIGSVVTAPLAYL